ncbi:MAG: SusD/RagB family nutrient-binding outer membrane lipoprotein [Bacteroidetes bacterium]|nr:SusD/RagB family nutrient-binding outer membrane lipoprotein [Bacteroidota bacterium]
MKNISKKLGIMLLFVASACQLDNDTTNPNNLTPSAADPDLLMNAIQLNFASFYSSASGSTDQLVRVNAMTGGYRYPTAINASSANGLWSVAYQGVLTNTKTLIPIAQAKTLTTHVAMAKIFEAYVYLTLVDIFNDVPRTEALLGTNFAPKTDAATDVYTYAIGLLTEARTELAKTGSAAGTNIASTLDLYYAGSRANWTALANTLELKAWLNIRTLPARVAEADAKITALLASNIIDSSAEDFTFKYGITTVPDSRHPIYNQYYGNTAGTAGGYLANYFLNEIFQGMGVQDPRWRYYVYRQVGSINPLTTVPAFDQKALGCTPGTPPAHYTAVNAVFCVFEPGFYGRDHGDASGTPPDSPVITCAGVYPAGGRPDNNSVVNTAYNKPTKRGDGANGAGIEPIWMAFYTDFIKAEISARRGDPVTAKTQLNTAINNSITAVKAFAVSRAQAVSPASLEPSTPAYLTAVNAAYDAATLKTDVIGREFYIAAFGNGVEQYNNYRRTSAPRNLQPTLQTGSGPWTRSFPYPATYTTLAGKEAKPNEQVNKVFWDGNTDILN